MHKSVQLFQKGCELGNADCCSAGGMELATGKYVEQNVEEARKLLNKACGHVGQSKACNMLGEMYLVGKYGTTKDLPTAAQYLHKACEGGRALSCRNLALMHLRGEGVEANKETAQKFWDKMFDIKEQELGRSVPRKGLPALEANSS